MKIKRDELYEKIWAHPMTHVAAEYGLSDNGLRKICRKLNIPWPSRGYWQKLAHNRKVKKTPLPPLGTEQSVVIERPDLRPDSNPAVEPEYILAEHLPGRQIRVPDKLSSPHLLVARLKKSLDLKRVDDKGLAWSQRGELNVHVSPASMDRALRILDTLIKELEKRGMKVAIDTVNERQSTCVVVRGEKLSFDMYEKYKQTEKAKTDRFSYNRFEYTPTGRLVLRIQDVWDVRKEWKDGQDQTLETVLNSFIRGLHKAADHEKEWRLRREREDQERREALLRQQEQQRLQALELEKRKQLEAEAANWQKSKILRAYIAEKRDKHIERHGPIQTGSEMEKWLAWASQNVENLDPLKA